MQNQPTPEQSLKLLDNVAANVPLSRNDHLAVQQAVAVLQEAITAPSPHDKKPAAKTTN